MKTIKDCLYGQIKIPKLCESFMNTAEFQRLRFTRQLGLVHYVYPSAVHTRFEHSIGVMYLAGKMVRVLSKQQKISERKRELIQLGALLHDLGHMSYSHLFDEFLKSSDGPLNGIFLHHEHEQRSVQMFKQINAQIHKLSSEEEDFVTNIILGNIPLGEPPYLYEIVCNKKCGVDVDKMDYLQRDAYHTGMHGFQSGYIIQNAVIDKNNHLAFLEKTRIDINDLFATRYRMHSNVYRHHTTRKIDKLYWCMMSTLGPKLFIYGDSTNDILIEALIQSSNDDHIQNLLIKIYTRDFDHSCDRCKDYDLTSPITQSGNSDLVPFV